MNDIIDYSLYTITSSSQFDDGISKLKEESKVNELKKLFRCIDEIIEGINMYEAEYSRPLENSSKVMHIHLDGRTTGDIIFTYTVEGRNIDLDLKLYNITDHENLSRISNKKYTKRQKFDNFDIIHNRYSEDEIRYAEGCYLTLISDYKFHQLHSKQKSAYTEKYLKNYFEDFDHPESLIYDDFLKLVKHFEVEHGKSIFASLDFSQPQHTAAITDREERYIMDIFQDYGMYIKDAYIETEVDEYDDVYEYMYVIASKDNFRDLKLLESELYSLEKLFDITFEVSRNGLGRYGRTYEFAHYFI